MLNGSKIILPPFLACLMVATISNAKELNVGISLRKDTYNRSIESIERGFETARVLFEQEYPKTKVNYVAISHGIELQTIVDASNEIIKRKLPAVLGGELSEESIVFSDLLNPQKIIFMTPTSTTPKVTKDKAFVFRGCFSDDQVADKLADYTVENLKAKRIGVVHKLSTPYTDFLAKRYIERLIHHQKKFSDLHYIHSKIISKTTNFGSIIDDFIKDNVTHVAMLVHSSDLLQFFVQASAKKYFPVYIGSDGWGSNEGVFRDLIERQPKDTKFVSYRNSYWKEDNHSPLTKKFTDLYQKKYSEKPGAWQAIAFDSAWILLHAMKNAANPNDTEAIRISMKNTRDIPLVTTNRISFDENNTPRKNLYIYKIDSSGAKFERSL